MRKLVALFAVVAPALAFAAPPMAGGPMGFALDPELQALHQEIAAIKLDRALTLSRDQARALLTILREATGLRDQMKAEHDRKRPDIVKALTAVRDDLRRNGAVSEGSQAALRNARGDSQRQEVMRKIKDVRQRAGAVLTPEQKERLRDFDPRPLALPAGESMDSDPFGPGDGPGAMGPGRGHGKGMRGGHQGGKKLIRIVLSPEFQGLLEARAK